uniref:Uncharacterized protein n=1 Tax=viral metagenome TaxID=1070528 RepID=A0A6M3JDV7_9ZZZZ
MRNDEIIEYIGKRLDELQMSADEAIVHLTRIARAPQAKALEFRGYDMAKVAREYADLVQKVKITKPAGEKGVDAVELVFYSRQEALKTILQAHEKIEKPSQVSVEVRLGFGGVLDRVYGDDPGEGKP